MATVWFLVTLNFLLPRAMPGDPISALENPSAPTYVRDDQTRASLESYYGLDRALPVQYVRYLGGLLHGDLGESIRYSAPVRTVIAERLPWTLLLVTAAVLLSTTLGAIAGINSGWRRGTALDRGLLSLFLSVRNFPAFFLGSLALYVFAVQVHWFPLAGATTPFSDSLSPWQRLTDVGSHLVLPATVLAVPLMAGQFLLMRASVVGELGADYLRMGRAKGLPERRLKYGYAARNALLPAVSLTAAQVGIAMAEVIFVETVFAYPGIGRLIFDAVSFRDYPVLQGCFLILTLVVVTMNLLADVLYLRLDPRTGA